MSTINFQGSFVGALKNVPAKSKQAFIDKACNVKKVDALRAAEDLGVSANLLAERRADVYEAFTGVNVRDAIKAYNMSCKNSGKLVDTMEQTVKELQKRVESHSDVMRANNEEYMAKSQDQIKYYTEKAKALGLIYLKIINLPNLLCLV